MAAARGPDAQDVTRFPVRFTGANKAMVVLGATPKTAYVDVTASELSVRFAFWFRAGRAALVDPAVALDGHQRVPGYGVPTAGVVSG